MKKIACARMKKKLAPPSVRNETHVQRRKGTTQRGQFVLFTRQPLRGPSRWGSRPPPCTRSSAAMTGGGGSRPPPPSGGGARPCSGGGRDLRSIRSGCWPEGSTPCCRSSRCRRRPPPADGSTSGGSGCPGSRSSRSWSRCRRRSAWPATRTSALWASAGSSCPSRGRATSPCRPSPGAAAGADWGAAPAASAGSRRRLRAGGTLQH